MRKTAADRTGQNHESQIMANPVRVRNPVHFLMKIYSHPMREKQPSGWVCTATSSKSWCRHEFGRFSRRKRLMRRGISLSSFLTCDGSSPVPCKLGNGHPRICTHFTVCCRLAVHLDNRQLGMCSVQSPRYLSVASGVVMSCRD